VEEEKQSRLDLGDTNRRDPGSVLLRVTGLVILLAL